MNMTDMQDASTTTISPATEPFDLMQSEAPSFAVLEEGRSWVFENRDHAESFRTTVEGLGTSGEEGRRRGLGLWMLGEYARCAEELAAFENDDTAAYTRGRALFGIQRYEEAEAIFSRLAQSYPNEPRPRASMLEAQLEVALAKGEDEGEIAQRLGGNLDATFSDTAEGCYVAGRFAELRRDWEAALDQYAKGREKDDKNRALLFRFAHLAERCGLDELAIELYETLLANPPSERNVLMNLGVLYEDHGRDTDAAACYDTIRKHNPTDLAACLYLSDAEAGMDMYYDEDMEKKEDRLNQILRIPITDFELSVRARNCLNKMQIMTLGDLVQRTEQELLSYKNFGETSLTEIKEILHSKGLRLGMPRDEAVASIEAHAQRMSTGDRSDVLNKPILELNLSIRARRTVETLGCLTLGDMTEHSADELLGMPNFGQTSLQELRSKLGEYGLKLKGD